MAELSIAIGFPIAALFLFAGATLVRGGVLHFFQTPDERYEIEREAMEAKRFALFVRKTNG